MQRFINACEPYLTNVYALMAGVATTVIGYFLPVKDILHLMIVLFIIDVFFGQWKARKVKKEKFEVKKIWETTMPRMLISIVLVLGAYSWDVTYKQEFISTYKIVGWFISGVLLYSIAENGYKITKWGFFLNISDLLKKKIKEQTDIDIKKQEDETNK